MDDNTVQKHIFAIGEYCEWGFVPEYLFDDVTKASQFLITLKMLGQAGREEKIIQYELNPTAEPNSIVGRSVAADHEEKREPHENKR